MTLPDNAPSWLVLGFFIVSLFIAAARSFSEASESAAKLFGPLGKRWRDRAEYRSNRKRTEREDVRADEDARISDLTDQVRYLKLRVAELEHVSDYLAYDAGWHRDVKVYMKEQGWELPPPRHLGLSEWKEFNLYQGGRS